MNQTIIRRLKRYSKWLSKETERDPDQLLKALKSDYPTKKQTILKHMRRYEQIHPKTYRVERKIN